MDIEIPDLNLVPTAAGKAANYWCTWSTQNVAWMEGLDRVDPQEMEGAAGAAKARATLNEEYLLGKQGWARQFFQRSRADMYLVLDDGWDAPTSGNMVEHLSSMILHGGRYPSHQGGTPAQRMRSLNDAVKAAGWRGIGVWLPANESGPYMDEHPDMEPEGYWRERLEWSREADIEYWKVDWGLFSSNHEFRKMLTRLGKEIHPDLVIEHSVGTGMFNNPGGRVDPRWLSEVVEQMSYADVVRLYDISTQLAIPSMLDRISAALTSARASPGYECLLNVEDELYIGAALGCTFGIMRHPHLGKPHFPLPEGTRDNDRRLVEVERAINWQRIAPPFPVGIGQVFSSDAILVDSYAFKEGETWDRSVIGKRVEQAAPAIISRNMALPRVTNTREGDMAYVVGSRNPNGAVSIASFGRVSAERGFRVPQCAVKVFLEDITAPIGIFGRFKEVTFSCSAPSRDFNSCTVYVQDLADTDAMNATGMVLTEKDSICITGGLIHEAGSVAAVPCDESDPAIVVYLE